MTGKPTRNEILNRALELAYFIQGDRDLALRIAIDAMDKLEVATAAQDKRLYYVPVGRRFPGGSRAERLRTKVSMGEVHLLQRLVYVESELHERQREQLNGGTPLDEEDMIIRFIKHLVRIAVKRNSFYVTLGISRLLHNYSTAETMEIYNLVIQDPERVKDDYYYRKVKRQLMQELVDRFRSLLEIEHGHRGEERFRATKTSGRWIGLVRECLTSFTPWDTPCVLPVRFHPDKDDISSLSFEGKDPDLEHPIEVNRIHTVLHPDCYSRTIGALKFDSPERRLEVPQFLFEKKADDETKPGNNRRQPPKLTEEELAAIGSSIADRAARRRSASAGLLSIAVDGTERLRLDLGRVSHARFEVEEGAELIEVRVREGDGYLLLATHVLTLHEMDGHDKPKRTSIVLEGGQRLSFTVSSKNDSSSEVDGTVVDFPYRETNPMKAVSLSLRRAGNRFAATRALGVWLNPPMLKPALALATIAMLGISVALYVHSGRQGTRQPLIAQQEKEAPAIVGEKKGKPSSQPTSPPSSSSVATTRALRKESPTKRPERRVLAPQLPEMAKNPLQEAESPGTPLPRTEVSEGESTRSPSSGSAPMGLVSVKSVYVESLGEDSFASEVRVMLMVRLAKIGRFTFAGDQSKADAVIKGSLGREGHELSLSMRLVNADGRVLWTKTVKGSEQNTDVTDPANVYGRIASGKTVNASNPKTGITDPANVYGRIASGKTVDAPDQKTREIMTNLTDEMTRELVNDIERIEKLQSATPPK